MPALNQALGGVVGGDAGDLLTRLADVVSGYVRGRTRGA
jgi:hypothetical protein